MLDCKRLTAKGIKTNVTLIFSAAQAILAANAGATYVSPFLGRLDDIGALPVVEETLDTDIGERVLYHLADDIIGHGRDIAARTRRLSNMNGIADRRGNYLRINTLYHENISYLADKLHSAFANVVKPSEERRYIKQ